MDGLRIVGLDRVAKELADLGVGEWEIGPVRHVLGRADFAGSSRPLPSSAVSVRLGEAGPVWLPAPLHPADPDTGKAPLYQHGGRLVVLPTVRLFARAGEEKPEEMTPQYLSLSDWLLDAVAVWRFSPREGGEPLTLLERLRSERPKSGEKSSQTLQAIARMLVYALFGSDSASTVCGLRLPPAPMWMRPVDESPFALEVARALVITARLDLDAEQTAIPSTNLRAAGYRIRPAVPRDWGIDPVHTPEGTDIRLTGRLGVGVAIRERSLVAPDAQRPALSASTSRLPFAGHNDPRRLLMAANMQAHAIELTHSEIPRIRNDALAPDPPGVDLKVGYLAWQGLNHEDAWVLSQSAADRLGSTEEVVSTVAIRAVELPPQQLVQVGQVVERGQPLIRRFISPVLLGASLELLATMPDLDEKVPLSPELDDSAPTEGTVVAIEEWELASGHGLPEGWIVPETVSGSYRSVLRFHIRRNLPLEVGDKLANRHGHKGIVGAILPDEAMPRWRGEPLEALIDPISVLNRSNWGQVFEALAGATVSPGKSREVTGVSATTVVEETRRAGADERGRWPILLPEQPAREIRAVAGVQFVMRMPHHARDRISGSPVPPWLRDRLRRRAQRLGEMDHWALWAHGGAVGPAVESQSEATIDLPVARLGRFLASAGFEMKREGSELILRRLALSATLPPEWKPFPLLKEPAAAKPDEGTETQVSGSRAIDSLARLFDSLDAVAANSPEAILFDPPLQSPSDPLEEIRWLPILPAVDRPNRRLFDASEEPHELTLAYRRVLRLLRQRERKRNSDDLDLFYTVRRLLSDAYAFAVGRSATGQFSSKRALLRRGVLGRTLPRSARATVSPSGPLGLDLDEIGLPIALAHVLFGPGLPKDDVQLKEAVDGRQVWLKRDPVLHRWGLLPVRVRLVPGHTIRMPASLLGPLGADFDGDTVAVFAELPGAPADVSRCSPGALSLHPILDEVMFKPGKQYQYGLHDANADEGRAARLRQALSEAGAPAWPVLTDAKAALQAWTKEAARPDARGRWWAILEEHALAAVASDPSLGFGLGDATALANLMVVRCGACKDLFSGEANQRAIADILAGTSLAAFHASGESARGPDPIADVMVAAKAAIGQFGGALRRLVYSAKELRPEDIQQAQCLTEQVTQAALSVKAGKPPLRYADFERHLRRLLGGMPLDEEGRKELEALLDQVGKRMGRVWEHLSTAMPPEQPVWLEWLRKPHELAELVATAEEIRLPLGDLRVRCWMRNTR